MIVIKGSEISYTRFWNKWDEFTKNANIQSYAGSPSENSAVNEYSTAPACEPPGSQVPELQEVSEM